MKKAFLFFALLTLSAANVYAACPDLTGRYGYEPGGDLTVTITQSGCESVSVQTSSSGRNSSENWVLDGQYRPDAVAGKVSHAFTSKGLVAYYINERYYGSTVLFLNDAGKLVIHTETFKLDGQPADNNDLIFVRR